MGYGYWAPVCKTKVFLRKKRAAGCYQLGGAANSGGNPQPEARILQKGGGIVKRAWTKNGKFGGGIGEEDRLIIPKGR